MGILNVDTIKPVGGGTTITLSTSEINVGTGITFESNGQAIYSGIITATSFSGSGANLTNVNVASATGDFSIGQSLVHLGDTDTKINFDTNTITLDTAGTERLRIASDGKICIGGNNPVHKLSIEGSSTTFGADSTLLHIGNDSYGINSYRNIGFGYVHPSSPQPPAIIGYKETHASGSTYGDLLFATRHAATNTAPTERLRIGSLGQIGIAGANYGTSGQVLTSQGASSAVAWSTISAGTEVYDTWIYTAETNVYAAGNYLTSNWSRFGDNIGSAITQSSGVFSFPSTGYYRVTFTCNFFERNSPDNIAYIYIQITTNNSSYTTRVASLENITDRTGDTYTTCHAHCLFDVTNTSTHKLRFYCGSDDTGDLRIAGAPSYQQVYAVFQKMGET